MRAAVGVGLLARRRHLLNPKPSLSCPFPFIEFIEFIEFLPILKYISPKKKHITGSRTAGVVPRDAVVRRRRGRNV